MRRRGKRIHSVENYRAVTSRIMAAALNPLAWEEVLAEIAVQLDGAKIHLFGHDMVSGTNLGYLAKGHDPDWLDAFGTYYGNLNPYPAAAGPLHPGRILDLNAVIPEDVIRRTEYFQDFLRPQEELTGGVGATLDASDGSLFVLGTMHPARLRDGLDAAAHRFVSTIAPDLAAGWRITKELCGARLVAGEVMEGVSGTALAVCDAGGWPRYLSPKATELIGTGDVVGTDRSGRLRFASSDLRARFGSLLTAICDPRALPRPAVLIDRLTGTEVEFLPVAQGAETLAPAHGFPLGLSGPALIVILRPAIRPDPAPTVLSLLTAAELDIVGRLSRGLTPQEIAGERGASLNTVRNQIKSAMSKCDVTRYTQLVAIYLRRK